MILIAEVIKMYGTIKDIRAIKVYDSRGMETIKVTATGEDFLGSYTVPKGASKGMKEGIELPVQEAIGRIETIIKPALVGMNYLDQKSIDDKLIELDSTPNLSHLGANSIVGTSLAVARLAAHQSNQILYRYLSGTNGFIFPIPMLNFLNGGMHSSSNLAIQEIMIVPFKFNSIQEALECGQKIYQTLKGMIAESGKSTAVGDEGGFAVDFESTRSAFDLLIKAIENAGYAPGEEVFIAIDAAANSFYDNTSSRYNIDHMKLTADELADYYEDLYNNYPLVSIEDPFEETDHIHYHELYKRLGHKMMIVGDDLYVTDYRRLAVGYQEKLSNSILIKPNQIGNLTLTYKAIDYAASHGMLSIISHRSGDNEDTFIADLAVAHRVPFIKTGSFSRSERVGKYNRLLELADIVGTGEYFYSYLKDLDIFRNHLNSLKKL